MGNGGKPGKQGQQVDVEPLSSVSSALAPAGEALESKESAREGTEGSPTASDEGGGGGGEENPVSAITEEAPKEVPPMTKSPPGSAAKKKRGSKGSTGAAKGSAASISDDAAPNMRPPHTEDDLWVTLEREMPADHPQRSRWRRVDGDADGSRCRACYGATGVMTRCAKEGCGSWFHPGCALAGQWAIHDPTNIDAFLCPDCSAMSNGGSGSAAQQEKDTEGQRAELYANRVKGAIDKARVKGAIDKARATVNTLKQDWGGPSAQREARAALNDASVWVLGLSGLVKPWGESRMEALGRALEERPPVFLGPEDGGPMWFTHRARDAQGGAREGETEEDKQVHAFTEVVRSAVDLTKHKAVDAHSLEMLCKEPLVQSPAVPPRLRLLVDWLTALEVEWRAWKERVEKLQLTSKAAPMQGATLRRLLQWYGDMRVEEVEGGYRSLVAWLESRLPAQNGASVTGGDKTERSLAEVVYDTLVGHDTSRSHDVEACLLYAKDHLLTTRQTLQHLRGTMGESFVSDALCAVKAKWGKGGEEGADNKGCEGVDEDPTDLTDEELVHVAVWALRMRERDGTAAAAAAAASAAATGDASSSSSPPGSTLPVVTDLESARRLAERIVRGDVTVREVRGAMGLPPSADRDTLLPGLTPHFSRLVKGGGGADTGGGGASAVSAEAFGRPLLTTEQQIALLQELCEVPVVGDDDEEIVAAIDALEWVRDVTGVVDRRLRATVKRAQALANTKPPEGAVCAPLRDSGVMQQLKGSLKELLSRYKQWYARATPLNPMGKSTRRMVDKKYPLSLLTELVTDPLLQSLDMPEGDSLIQMRQSVHSFVAAATRHWASLDGEDPGLSVGAGGEFWVTKKALLDEVNVVYNLWEGMHLTPMEVPEVRALEWHWIVLEWLRNCLEGLVKESVKEVKMGDLAFDDYIVLLNRYRGPDVLSQAALDEWAPILAPTGADFRIEVKLQPRDEPLPPFDLKRLEKKTTDEVRAMLRGINIDVRVVGFRSPFLLAALKLFVSMKSWVRWGEAWFKTTEVLQSIKSVEEAPTEAQLELLADMAFYLGIKEPEDYVQAIEARVRALKTGGPLPPRVMFSPSKEERPRPSAQQQQQQSASAKAGAPAPKGKKSRAQSPSPAVAGGTGGEAGEDGGVKKGRSKVADFMDLVDDDSSASLSMCSSSDSDYEPDVSDAAAKRSVSSGSVELKGEKVDLEDDKPLSSVLGKSSGKLAAKKSKPAVVVVEGVVKQKVKKKKEEKRDGTGKEKEQTGGKSSRLSSSDSGGEVKKFKKKVVVKGEKGAGGPHENGVSRPAAKPDAQARHVKKEPPPDAGTGGGSSSSAATTSTVPPPCAASTTDVHANGPSLKRPLSALSKSARPSSAMSNKDAADSSSSRKSPSDIGPPSHADNAGAAKRVKPFASFSQAAGGAAAAVKEDVLFYERGGQDRPTSCAALHCILPPAKGGSFCSTHTTDKVGDVLSALQDVKADLALAWLADAVKQLGTTDIQGSNAGVCKQQQQQQQQQPGKGDTGAAPNNNVPRGYHPSPVASNILKHFPEAIGLPVVSASDPTQPRSLASSSVLNTSAVTSLSSVGRNGSFSSWSVDKRYWYGSKDKRDRARRQLWDKLHAAALEAGRGDVSAPLDAGLLAFEIEACLHGEYSGEEYRTRLQALRYALGANRELVRRVLDLELSADDLVKLGQDDLATQEERDEKEKAKKKALANMVVKQDDTLLVKTKDGVKLVSTNGGGKSASSTGSNTSSPALAGADGTPTHAPRKGHYKIPTRPPPQHAPVTVSTTTVVAANTPSTLPRGPTPPSTHSLELQPPLRTRTLWAMVGSVNNRNIPPLGSAFEHVYLLQVARNFDKRIQLALASTAPHAPQIAGFLADRLVIHGWAGSASDTTRYVRETDKQKTKFSVFWAGLVPVFRRDREYEELRKKLIEGNRVGIVQPETPADAPRPGAAIKVYLMSGKHLRETCVPQAQSLPMDCMNDFALHIVVVHKLHDVKPPRLDAADSAGAALAGDHASHRASLVSPVEWSHQPSPSVQPAEGAMLSPAVSEEGDSVSMSPPPHGHTKSRSRSGSRDLGAVHHGGDGGAGGGGSGGGGGAGGHVQGGGLLDAINQIMAEEQGVAMDAKLKETIEKTVGFLTAAPDVDAKLDQMKTKIQSDLSSALAFVFPGRPGHTYFMQRLNEAKTIKAMMHGLPPEAAVMLPPPAAHMPPPLAIPPHAFMAPSALHAVGVGGDRKRPAMDMRGMDAIPLDKRPRHAAGDSRGRDRSRSRSRSPPGLSRAHYNRSFEHMPPPQMDPTYDARRYDNHFDGRRGERDRDRSRERSRESHRERSRDRGEVGRSRDRSRERERGRSRDRSRERDRGRERDRDRDRDRERERWVGRSPPRRDDRRR